MKCNGGWGGEPALTLTVSCSSRPSHGTTKARRALTTWASMCCRLDAHQPPSCNSQPLLSHGSYTTSRVPQPSRVLNHETLQSTNALVADSLHHEQSRAKSSTESMFSPSATRSLPRGFLCSTNRRVTVTPPLSEKTTTTTATTPVSCKKLNPHLTNTTNNHIRFQLLSSALTHAPPPSLGF